MKKLREKLHPWPCGLAAALVAFICFQLSVVTLATTTFEGLDEVEYYRFGVEYGQEMARRKHQRELGWVLDSRLRGPELYLAIVDADGKPVQRAEVQVEVGRPATRRDDRHYRLDEIGPGIYRTRAEVGQGAWRLQYHVEKGDHIVKVEHRVDLSGDQGGSS